MSALWRLTCANPRALVWSTAASDETKLIHAQGGCGGCRAKFPANRYCCLPKSFPTMESAKWTIPSWPQQQQSLSPFSLIHPNTHVCQQTDTITVLPVPRLSANCLPKQAGEGISPRVCVCAQIKLNPGINFRQSDATEIKPARFGLMRQSWSRCWEMMPTTEPSSLRLSSKSTLASES